MRKALIALVALLLVAVSCRTGAVMWGGCPPTGDRTGTDGTYVLVCRDGTWVPVMTVDEYVRLAQGKSVTIAPLPTRPVPTTTAPTSTSSSTTSITIPSPSPSPFATVVAGTDHACGLTQAGGVRCWGANSLGQLGDGTTTGSPTPVDVTGLTSGVVSISAGANHTCALTSTGGVKCWGWNGWSQLGDGTSTDRSTPVDVAGLTSGVASISAGTVFTCAVTTTGGAKCWGANGNGELGTGDFVGSPTPVDVAALTSGVASISAGTYHACAVTTSGGAKCWGYNGQGRLGENNGSNVNRTSPVDVVGLTSGVASISAGDMHTCALTTSGGAKCWGSNNAGRLGDGTTTDRPAPVDVTGLTSGVASIRAGGTQTCAVTTTGGARCWGSNTWGQIGDGTSGNVRTAPVDVSGLTAGVADVDPGNFDTCAALAAGGGRCWGSNASGQLGDGTTTDSDVPVTVLP